MSFKLCVFILVAIVAASHGNLLDCLPNCHNSLTLGKGLPTLGCIILHLCGSALISNDDAKVKAFADCYDEDGAKGKEQFFGCMQGALNNQVLNTTAVVKDTCKHIYRMGSYAKCLPTAFAQANINMDEVVTRVNICQGKALGIGNGKV